MAKVTKAFIPGTAATVGANPPLCAIRRPPLFFFIASDLYRCLCEGKLKHRLQPL